MFKETSCTLQWVKVVKNYKAQKFMNMHNAQKRKTLFINTMTSLSIHEKKHSEGKEFHEFTDFTDIYFDRAR
jgi:hypothetical protein